MRYRKERIISVKFIGTIKEAGKKCKDRKANKSNKNKKKSSNISHGLHILCPLLLNYYWNRFARVTMLRKHCVSRSENITFYIMTRCERIKYGYGKCTFALITLITLLAIKIRNVLKYAQLTYIVLAVSDIF